MGFLPLARAPESKSRRSIVGIAVWFVGIWLCCCGPVWAHYSIIPQSGYKAPGPQKIEPKDLSQFARAESEHFIIYTTLDEKAAADICRHLEVWHGQVKQLFPNFDEVEAYVYEQNRGYRHHTGRKVAMKVFAYGEEKGDFYNRPPMYGNTTGGVVCRENSRAKDLRTIKVTALQHEITHLWRWRYFPKNRSIAMSEGLADFLGLWNIDKTEDANIHNMENSIAYKVAEVTQVGNNNKASKWHWMSAQEFFSNRGPDGSMVYQQGWWFFRFLFSSDAGRDYKKVVFAAYRADPLAEQYLNDPANRTIVKEEFRDTDRQINKLEGGFLEVPFTDEFLESLDKDWREFVRKECKLLNVDNSCENNPQQAYQRLFMEEDQRVSLSPNTLDDAQFAQQLWQSTRSLADLPKFQAYLCNKTFEFGINNRRALPVAIEALKFLVQLEPSKTHEIQEKLLVAYKHCYHGSQGMKKAEAGECLQACLISGARRKMEAGDVVAAVEMYREALRVAQSANSPLRENIRTHLKRAVALAKSDSLATSLPEFTADKLVLWNQNNGGHADRGSLSVNVVLFDGEEPVYRRDSFRLIWKPGEDCYNTIALPAIRFDRVRVEVVQWQRRGGGLSEIQLFKDDQNIALGKKTQASTTYDERFPHSSLTDGITSSARKARGYWLLPNSTAGWAEVYLAED
ncbi:MAG: hypothetical protein KAT11_00625 [Phycisphaerae bacterium]|nr:hypothetical protein [Phycisphaerae bacterium]